MKKTFKILTITLGVGMIFIMFIRLLFPIYHIGSRSMEPTINKGEYIIVNRLYYKFFEPGRNDIVLFKATDKIFELGPWTHRIIAVNEDLVSIKDNLIYVNDKSVLFPDVDHKDLNTIVEEVSNYIKEKHPKIKKVGLLSTIGTYKSKIYSEILEKNNIDVITPTKKIKQDLVHNAIYNKLYGIKSQSNPVSSIAKAKLIEAVKYLQNQGAEAIILGCTEIPLAIKNKDVSNLILIDPTTILARSLIKETYPNKLK